MGVSFKISKSGTRFNHKPISLTEEVGPPCQSANGSTRVVAGAAPRREVNLAEIANDAAGNNLSSTFSGALVLPEHEVSFTLSLYQKGYLIGKPTELDNSQPLLQDAKSLHPYDRASETMFSAIESGRLPGDILDDIPSKYYNGAIVCEVRDYRNCASEQGSAVSATNDVPVVHKVQLRMSLENVVKDIPLISDDSWTYSDLMEVESRIVKALQPQLHLDPTPMLDRLCHDPVSTKLNLGLGRKKRLRQAPEVVVTYNNITHGKKVCIDRVPENPNCKAGDVGLPISNAADHQVHESISMQTVSGGTQPFRSNSFAQEPARTTLPLSSQTKVQQTVNYPGVAVHDRGYGPPVNYPGVNASTSSQSLMGSYPDANAPLSMKRENQDVQLPILDNKRAKQTSIGVDGMQQQQAGPQLGGLTGPGMQWKNQLLHPQLDVKGIQSGSAFGGQRYPSPSITNMHNQEAGASFYFNQQGMRFGTKEEQIDQKLDRREMERSKDGLQAMATENSVLDQQQQQSTRNSLSNLTQWPNARLLVDKDVRRDDMLQKRRPVHSPHVSSGPMVQSPVSSKSGEISSGSVGGQFSAVATTSAMGSQKDKLAANTNAAVGAPSVTSSPSDSMHRQHQPSVVAKRKSNSVTKTQVMSGVGSPASVGNMTAPLNASSPSIGTASMGDQKILERFAKIEAVTKRCQLNIRKKKVDNFPARKPMAYERQQLAYCLSDSCIAEDFTDPVRPISRSLLGGTINTYKNRIMNFVRTEHIYQGVVPTKPDCQLVMSEKPCDGTVGMQYGDVEDSDHINFQDSVLTLPTTHYADLLASQFCVLMERDGYQKTEDQIRPIPVRMTPSGCPSTLPGAASDNAATEVKHQEVAPSRSSNVGGSVNNNVMGPANSAQNLSNTRMLASGNNSQAVALSQGYLPGPAISARSQQLDQPLLQQQQQQQQQSQQLQPNSQPQLQQQQQVPLPHIQRSASLLSTNHLSHLIGQNSNFQMGANHMVNSKPTAMQLQLLQQQAQQQQQQSTQLPRKVMMGLGPAMAMGNMGNNVVGVSGLSNVMSMGNARGISSQMGPMSALGSINPNQMNLGTASNFAAGLRQSPLSPVQAATIKLRLAQQRAGIYNSQSGLAGMTGSSNQMLPSSAGLSMLGALNRANMNTMQRNTMSPMGPPKILGANSLLNSHLQMQPHQPHQQQQQLHQQQQQQFQQQQLQQQQQMQQQQQQIGSPLQQAQVGSPVVGSPPAMVMQQQQISPQKMGQHTAMSPQQLSSGALQQMNTGGNAGGPASPQLSSQTHGSVGSITSSPMEQLQGANKGSTSNI
ncbi:protein PHYTOCHROME-DEPENDENT LATE-FLOWERING [Typha angustifolia]|uniref:protein PHYTOCHROME-DEPENDENT LATE-FLOWERING n=1 Tax=Typha angustifolia TaxID=59011 RepID=UPI003C2EF66E